MWERGSLSGSQHLPALGGRPPAVWVLPAHLALGIVIITFTKKMAVKTKPYFESPLCSTSFNPHSSLKVGINTFYR